MVIGENRYAPSKILNQEIQGFTPFHCLAGLVLFTP